MNTRISLAASLLFGSLVLSATSCQQEIVTGVCETAADCAGIDTPCQTRVCKDNACGVRNETDGKSVVAQIDGDCKELVCNGKGGTRIQALAEGAACSEAGGKLCNASGICVVCSTAADCNGDVCLDGACMPASCMDSAKNGAETDVDCGGASCVRCEDGKACAKANDCKSHVCEGSVCKAGMCGDGTRQGTEECDDGNAQSGDGCTPNCKADVIFADDMETGAIGWTHQKLSGEFITDQWSVTDARAASGTFSYGSGPSAPFEGDTRLLSPVIDLSSVPLDAQVRLTFKEFHHFDDCGDFDFDSDGGLLEVLTGTTPFDFVELMTPVDGYPDTLDDTCGNPIAGRPAFTHDTSGKFHTVEVDLTQYAGRAIRMAFHVGWDCGNCALEEGWYIDDVRVERLP